MKCIGIFGGTFDPIHDGHLFLARAAAEHFALDEIWFLPLNIPPHKEAPAATVQQRMALITKAIANHPSYSLCNLEISRPGITYTVDTLRLLHQKEHARFAYIIGSDTLIDLPNWKDYRQVLTLCSFICIPRTGAADLQKTANRLRQDGAQIRMLAVTAPDISSSMIKSRLQNGLSVAGLIPKNIEQDVLTIYTRKENKSPMNRQELLDKLKPLIDETRYQHTLSTEKTAIMLAKCHGVNSEKASLAALLHDCAKAVSKNPKAFCEKYHIEAYLPLYKDYPLCVIHAPLGAHMAKAYFGVDDPEILSAITWHTSGKPDMSPLDAVIYLADYTEPTRHSTPELEEIRALSKTDMDHALLKAMDYSIARMKKKDFPIHHTTLDAYAYYKNKLEAQI